MLAADPAVHSVRDLKQLMKVRRMRLDAAKRQLALQMVAVTKAEEAVEKAKDDQLAAQKALQAFRERMAGESAAALVAMGSLVGHFRERLAVAIDDALEAIEEAEKQLGEAKKKLTECRAALRREQARYDAIEEAHRRGRLAQARIVQARDEDEVGDMRRTVVAGGALLAGGGEHG